MWGEVPDEHAQGDQFHNEGWQNQNKTRRHNETGLCAAYVVFSLFFLWLCLIACLYLMEIWTRSR